MRLPGSIAMLTLGAAALLAGPTATHGDTICVGNYGDNTTEQFTADGVGSVFANTGFSRP